LDIWSLWGCAACVEKELNEGTCLFVNFILPARGAAPPLGFVRAVFRNLSVSTLHRCMYGQKKIMMVEFRCTAFAEAATEK
jgi:hypothetical protein